MSIIVILRLTHKKSWMSWIKRNDVWTSYFNEHHSLMDRRNSLQYVKCFVTVCPPQNKILAAPLPCSLWVFKSGWQCMHAKSQIPAIFNAADNHVFVVYLCDRNLGYAVPVVRTSFCSLRTFPGLRLIHSWHVTTVRVRRPLWRYGSTN